MSAYLFVQLSHLARAGHIEIDGCYVGGTVRPANQTENRVDRRIKENKNGNRRVVVALRERKGRTLPFVTQSESDGVQLTIENVGLVIDVNMISQYVKGLISSGQVQRNVGSGEISFNIASLKRMKAHSF